MTKRIRFVGMDVHQHSIDLTVAESGHDGAVTHFASIGGDPAALDGAVAPLRQRGAERFLVYEAGPCGYGIYRHLRQAGLACAVVAPAQVPKQAADRVKTDRRDARTLAVQQRAGALRPITVPDEDDEAMRDLVRAREDAVHSRRRARQRVNSFLLRHGRAYPCGKKNWGRAASALARRARLPARDVPLAARGRRAASAAGGVAHRGGDRRGRGRRSHPLHPARVDGVSRLGFRRVLQRGAPPPRRPHQDRERPRAPCAPRSRAPPIAPPRPLATPCASASSISRSRFALSAGKPSCACVVAFATSPRRASIRTRSAWRSRARSLAFCSTSRHASPRSTTQAAAGRRRGGPPSLPPPPRPRRGAPPPPPAPPARHYRAAPPAPP